ncbi:hypothetical protein FHC51_10880 [Leclercia sp. EC_58]|uniref:hypothetical protein n=1 Tax=Leclercia sp. EC_58 TaxID=2584090 RepID=UPI001C6FD6A9|nr:hypothetical protein [Leclercia sp. EC_58]MBW9400313.1 hypothetical protein [Leclercia sp. EC_58]
MTKFTKEQLIEKLERRLAVTTHYPDVEEAQLDAQIFKIALAALTEQPVGFYRASRHGDGYYLANNMEQTLGTIPLYRLPLLEGLK